MLGIGGEETLLISLSPHLPTEQLHIYRSRSTGVRESGSGSGDAFAARAAIDGGRRRWTGPGAACGCRPARQINVLRLRLSLSLSVSLTHSPRASCIHAYSMCCLCARPAKTHQTTRKTMFSATNGLRPTYQAATNPGKGKERIFLQRLVPANK